MAAPQNVDHRTRLIAGSVRRYEVSQEIIRRSTAVLARTGADLDATRARLGAVRSDRQERETPTVGESEAPRPAAGDHADSP